MVMQLFFEALRSEYKYHETASQLLSLSRLQNCPLIGLHVIIVSLVDARHTRKIWHLFVLI